jgi:hypothetical protein
MRQKRLEHPAREDLRRFKPDRAMDSPPRKVRTHRSVEAATNLAPRTLSSILPKPCSLIRAKMVLVGPVAVSRKTEADRARLLQSIRYAKPALYIIGSVVNVATTHERRRTETNVKLN